MDDEDILEAEELLEEQNTFNESSLQDLIGDGGVENVIFNTDEAA